MSLLRTSTVPPLVVLARNLSLTSSLAKKGRSIYNKLPKPEDKSNVIIGKQRRSAYFPKEGVSDKTHPILVKWKRPRTVQTCNPEISGDVGGLDSLGLSSLDLTQPPVALDHSKALEAASPEVKRVLSLDFARRRDVLAKLSSEIVKSIQRHPRDFTSTEVKIAMQTVKIRNMQHALIEQWPYKNQPQKHFLTHLVSSRRKNLERLRQSDYKKYEWLLEKLNLLYKPMPYDRPEGVKQEKENIERKKSVEKLTDLWCEELQNHRMKAYEKQLEKQQPDFLRKKAEKLKEIMEKETKLGLTPTVFESEVLDCLKQAEEIEEHIAKAKESQEEDNYLIYKEEVVRETNIFVSN